MIGHDLLAQRFEAKFGSDSVGWRGLGEVQDTLRIVKAP